MTLPKTTIEIKTTCIHGWYAEHKLYDPPSTCPGGTSYTLEDIDEMARTIFASLFPYRTTEWGELAEFQQDRYRDAARAVLKLA